MSARSSIYRLAPSGSENILYSFAGLPDGASPFAGLVPDDSGNLYGTTESGGLNADRKSNRGTVFELSAADRESVLYSLGISPDGDMPYGELVRDSAGYLYGVTMNTVFRIPIF